MRKAVLSLVVILITIITSFYLIYDFNTYKDKLLEQQVSYSELPPKETVEVSQPENERPSDSVAIEKPQEHQTSVAEDDIEDINTIDEIDETNDIDDAENIVSEEKTVAVFKVNKETIPKKISLKDKAKLLKIVGKLSIIDYGNIVEIMNGYDELGGATKIFNILKTRLSEEDYQEVKEILYPYLYVENIEENINSDNAK